MTNDLWCYPDSRRASLSVITCIWFLSTRLVCFASLYLLLRFYPHTHYNGAFYGTHKRFCFHHKRIGSSTLPLIVIAISTLSLHSRDDNWLLVPVEYDPLIISSHVGCRVFAPLPSGWWTYSCPHSAPNNTTPSNRYGIVRIVNLIPPPCFPSLSVWKSGRGPGIFSHMSDVGIERVVERV